MKIKSWKVAQIIHDMAKYGDRFNVAVKGHEFCTSMYDYEDENGYLVIENVNGIKRETEKAMLLDIDGFDCWVPKSAVEM